MYSPVIIFVGVLLVQECIHCQLAKEYYSYNSGDNNEVDTLEYVPLYKEHPCLRRCDTANEMQVCKGDEVIVDVVNLLGSESTTIHWHGQLQESSPYMDGVPYVTQCPIQPASKFRYHFRANNAGTHFWHSHSGFQRGDGAFGPFIVRVPEEDNPHFDEYDHDLSAHTFTMIDWDTVTGLDKFLAHHHSDGNNKPSTLLVNGVGSYAGFDADNNRTVYVPPAKFTVKQGLRYRFRSINAGFLNCPIEISVDNHTLEIISTDGHDIETIQAESLTTYAGERFDFIITANQVEGQYLMRFRGLMDCGERFKKAHQVAILQYETQDEEIDPPLTTYEESHKDGLQINPLNIGTEGDTSSFVAAPLLKSLRKWDSSLKEIPDFQYYIAYDFYKLNNPHFQMAPYYGFSNVTETTKRLLTPQLNHITMKYPTFPFLTQRDEIDEENMFCNETTMDKCGEDFCECTHVVKIALGSVVEMILIDEGFAFDANHPFHLHGNSFRVVAMERLGRNTTLKEVIDKDKKNEIRRNLKDAPVKDTVTVPDGGYTIIRFRATNPGYWLFHCHIEFHSEIGMAILFKVGEHSQMTPIPKYFPRCGDYLPDPKSDKIDCDYKTFRSLFSSQYCNGMEALTASKVWQYK